MIENNNEESQKTKVHPQKMNVLLISPHLIFPPYLRLARLLLPRDGDGLSVLLSVTCLRPHNLCQILLGLAISKSTNKIKERKEECKIEGL